MANVVQALLRIQGEPTGAIQALKTVQSEAKATGAAAVRVTEQVNRNTQTSLAEMQKWADEVRQTINKLNNMPTNKDGSMKQNVAKQLIMWNNELLKTLQNIDKLQNGVINTSYKMSTATGPINRIIQALSQLGQAGSKGVSNFAQAAITALRGLQQLGNAAQFVGRAAGALTPYGVALLNIARRVPGVAASTTVLRQVFAHIGQVATNAARSLGSMLAPAATRAAQVLRTVATAAMPGGRAVLAIATASMKAAQGAMTLIRSAGQLVGHLGRVASAAMRAASSLGRIGGRAMGMAFASTGTHIAGMAVRLQGMQMGLFALGGAMTAMASKGRAAFGEMLEVAGKFEQQIVTLQQTLGKMGESYSKEEFQSRALELGERTMYSPTEAADVMTELVKGGMRVDQVMQDATKSTLDLAQATGEDLETATRAIINSTTAWARDNITAREAADTLTQGANASAASVKELAGGMKNVSGVAPILGMSLKETVSMLGALNNVGIRGPEAGTALRYALLGLVPATQKNIELMKEYGLMTMDMGKAAEYSGRAVVNQEDAMQAMFEKWSGSKRSFADAIAEEDPAVARFQQYLNRHQIITSEFVNKQTGELKDAATIMDTLWQKIGAGRTEVERTRLASALFGERGGSKGIGNLLAAYEQNLKLNQAGAKDARGNPLSLDPNVINHISKEMGNMGSASDIAEQRVKTFAGATERLASTMEAFKITLGGPLLEPLAGFINKISDVISAIRMWLEANPEMAKTAGTLGLIAVAAASVIGPLAMMGATFPYIIMGLKGMMMALAPMGAIMLLVSGIITGVGVALGDERLGLSGKFAGLADMASTVLPAALNFLGQVFNEIIMPIAYAIAIVIVDVVLPAFNELGSWFSNTGPSLFGGFAQFVRDTVVPVIFQIAVFLREAIPVAIQFLVGVWNSLLMPVFQGLANIWTNILAPALGQFLMWLGQSMPAVINVLVSVWTGLLQPAFEVVALIIGEFLLPAIMTLVNWLGEVLPPVLEFVGYAINTWIIPIIQKASEIFGLILPPIMAVVGAIIQFLIPVFRAVFDTVGPILTFFLDLVITVFNWIGTAISWLADQWNNGFLEPIRHAVEFVWGKIVEFWEGIMGFFEDVGNAIGEFFDWVTGKTSEAGEEIPAALNENLQKGLDDTQEDTKVQVQSLTDKFQSLQAPAGTAGYNSGFNFGSNISSALSQFMPEVQKKVEWFKEQLLAVVAMRDEIRRGEGMGTYQAELDYWRRKLAATGDKAVIPKSTGYQGATNIVSDEESEYPEDTPYNSQTDNRQGRGGGGGGGGGTKRSPAEEAADIIKKTADAIKAGIEAFRKIAALSIPKNLEAKAKEFADAVAVLVMALQSVSTRFKEEAMKHTELFTETGGKAVDMLGKGIDAFSKLKDFTAPAQDKIVAFRDSVKFLLLRVAEAAADFTTDGLAHAQLFSESGEKGTSMLEKGIAAFASLGKFVKPAEDRIEAVVQAIKFLMLKVNEISDSLGPEEVDRAAAYTEGAGKVTDSITKMADLVNKLNDPKLNLSPATERIKTLANEMLAMMNYLGDLWTQNPGWTEENAAKVAGLGESAGKVGGGLTSVATMLESLSKMDDISFASLDTRVQELSNALIAMMNYLGPLAAPWEGFSDKPAKFAEDGGKVAGGLIGLMDMFARLDEKDTRKVEFRNLAERVVELANGLAHMVNAIKVAIGENPDVAGLSEYADAANKSADSLLKIIELFSALGQKGLKLASDAQIEEVIETLVEMVQDYRETLAEFGIALDEESVKSQQASAQISESMATIASSLGTALETMAATSNFKKGKADPKVVVQDLLAFMVDFVKEFAKVQSELEEVMDEETAALSERVGGAVGSIGDTLSVFDELTRFREVGPAQIQSFIKTLDLMVQELQKLPGTIGEDALDAAEAFGTKLGPAFDLMSNALSLFMAMLGQEEETEGGGVVRRNAFTTVDPNAVREFVGKLHLLLYTLREGLLNDFAPEFLELANEFGTKMGPAMEVLTSALSLFININPDSEGKGGLKTVDPNAIGALVGNLYLLMSHWRNLIIGGEFQGDFGSRSEAFSGIVESVLENINNVLGIAQRIAELNENGTIDNLPAKMQTLVDALRVASQITFPQIEGEVAGSLTDISTELGRHVEGKDEDSIGLRWYGKDPKKSLLHRMWFAVEGKAGFRPTIRLAFIGLFTELTTAFEEWRNQIVPYWESVMGELVTLTTTAIQTITGALNGITSGSITVTVNYDGGIPQLATGGIVTGMRPQLAVIGDGREPEMVLPLSKAHEMGFGGKGGGTQNYYYNVRHASVNTVTDLAKNQRRLRNIQNNRT